MSDDNKDVERRFNNFSDRIHFFETNILIMKTIKTCLLCLVFMSFSISVSYAAELNSSLQFRNIRQQTFAQEYIKNHEPESGFESPQEVLNFMQDLSKAWAQSVANQSKVYQRLNTYVPMWAVHTLFKNEIPSGSECLIYSKIALPSFIKDVDFLNSQLQTKKTNLTEAAFLIRISNFTWAATASPTYRCHLEDDQWRNLKNAVINFPDIIQSYLDAEALPASNPDEYRQSYRQVQSVAASVRPCIELQDKIYQNKLSDAFANLSAQLPASDIYYRYIYVKIGKRLFQEYKDNNQKELAFSTLDLLARNTSEETLSRRELRSMYEETDPRLGPAIFESIIINQSGSIGKSQQRQNLSGSFFDARSGTQVVLESFKNQFLVIDFWSVSCGPCIEEIPALNKFANKYRNKATLISINTDLIYGLNKEDLQEFVANHGIEYPVLLDTEEINMMQRFGVGGWPTRFLLSKEGYFYMEPIEKRIKLSLREIVNFLKQE